MIIAIDGPAAAGKGTLARAIADKFSFAYLDTGSLYRAVAHAVLLAGAEPTDETVAIKAAQNLDVAQIDPVAIRTPDVAAAASVVAAMVPVRAAILQFQRKFAQTPPNNAKGAVLDGRDIGTVVCPEADAKLFVSARAEIRAHRRWLELKGSGSELSEAQVLADVSERDRRDQERAHSPLKPAQDAYLLDTSDLSIETAFEQALAFIEGSKG